VGQFLRRLSLRSRLSAEEQQVILSLDGRTEKYRAHQDIVSPGELVDAACLVADGLVGRFDQMRDGQRQLTSFYIAGDMCDLHSVVAPRASWSITAISNATTIRVPHADLQEVARRYPTIAMAFWRDDTVDASILAKWVGNLGRKSSIARVAHLFCEMAMRSEAGGLGTRTSFEFHATQEQLADATGITTVHLNRTLQEIRRQNLLTFISGRVNVLDWDGLASVAEFDPSYLLFDAAAHRQPKRLGEPQMVVE
jgi:CRP-like cAMP-binding protein